MYKIKNSLRCFYILCKRLLHKKSFVTIMLLIPMLVGAMGILVTGGDSGVLTIALAMRDNEDTVAQEMVADLTDSGGLIRFTACNTTSEAVSLVESGKADAAWIFSKDMKEKIAKFASHTNYNNAFVTIVQREDSIFLKLAQEKLNSTVYPYISRELFAQRVISEFPHMTAAEYEKIYNSVKSDGEELFDFVYSGENALNPNDRDSEESFLISPLRGLLAIMTVIGGMAVAMFYMQDEEHGVFDRFPRSAGFSFSVLYHATAVLMLGAVVFAALLITGMAGNAWYELIAIILYCTATVGFCICLRLILREIRIFGSIAPVLVVVMAVLCPVFFKAPSIPIIQYLLPTYHYLNSFSNPVFLLYMVAYSVASLTLALLLHRLSAKLKG